jgi:hypothetical protein
MPRSSYGTALAHLHTEPIPPTIVGRFFNRIGLRWLGNL